MNFSSKLFFKKRTGYPANDYGSVFLFLNGFRVSPYGNPKNDWLGLDQRKTQGTSRYLGTRDVIGQVLAVDSEDLFKPVTSREGLVHDEVYHELTASDPDNKVTLRSGKSDYGYVTHIVRQLERFIVDGLNWHSLMDLSDPERKNLNEAHVRPDPSRYAIRSIDQVAVKEAIDKTLRTSNFDIQTFNVNYELIGKLAEEADDAYNEFVLSFIQNTTNKTFDELTSVDKGNFRKIALRNMDAIKAEKEAKLAEQLQRMRAEEAERNAERERLRAENAETAAKSAREKQTIAENSAATFERTARVEKKRRLFAESSQKPDSKKNQELIHHIGNLGSEIAGDLNDALDAISDNRDIQDIEELIKSAVFHNEKLLSLANVITRADFDMMSDILTEDVFSFASQYLAQLGDLSTSYGLKTHFRNPDKLELFATFSPIEMTMLIDNILDNASNFHATGIEVLASRNREFTTLEFINDGDPLTEKYQPDELFHRGISTTSGSGIGLSQVKRIARSFMADVRIENNQDNGVSLKIRWKN